jgi:hypothetical protein
MEQVTQESLVQAQRRCLESNSVRYYKNVKRSTLTMLKDLQSTNQNQQSQYVWRENQSTWNLSQTTANLVIHPIPAGKHSNILCSHHSIKQLLEAAAWATSKRLSATVIGSPLKLKVNLLLLRNNKLLTHWVTRNQSIRTIEDEVCK